MRFKHRYFLCEVKYFDDMVDQSVTSSMLFRALQGVVEQHYGDYGAGSLQGFSVKYYNPLTGLLIVRSNRDNYRVMWNALTMLSSLKQRLCTITVVHIGGKHTNTDGPWLVFSFTPLSITLTLSRCPNNIHVSSLQAQFARANSQRWNTTQRRCFRLIE